MKKEKIKKINFNDIPQSEQPYTLKKEILVKGKLEPLVLKDYQKEAIKYVLARDTSIVALDVGTGKSLTIFCVSFIRLNKNLVDYSIIVGTPKSVSAMKKDMLKLTNCKPYLIEDLESYLSFFNQKEKRVAFMSYSMKSKLTRIQKDRIKVLPEVLEKIYNNRVMFLFDETHKIKNPQSQVTQFFREITLTVQYKAGFSGTVYTSNILDLFYLVDFYDEAIFKSYINFVRSFIVYRPIQIGMKTINQIWKLKNYQLLKDSLSNIMYSYYPVLDVVFHESMYELTEDTKIEYISTSLGFVNGDDTTDDLDEDDLYEDEDDDGSLLTFSARMVKMQYVLDRDSNKQQTLLDLVKNSSDKGCIVYVQYHKTLKILSDLFHSKKLEHRQIHGKMTMKVMEENLEWFLNNPVDKTLFISDAGGESLNLQVVNDIIFYNIPCPIGKFRQVAGRICRLGSNYDKFNIKLLMCENTLDQYKYMYNTSLSEIYMNLFGTHICLPSAEGISSFNTYLLQQTRKTMLWDSNKTLNKEPKEPKRQNAIKEKKVKEVKKQVLNQVPMLPEKSFWQPNKNRFN